jgi:hypothetical protein
MRYSQGFGTPGAAVPALTQRARSAAGRRALVAATGSAHARRPGPRRARAAAVALAPVTAPADLRRRSTRRAVETSMALRLLAPTHVPAARGWTQVRARSILPSDSACAFGRDQGLRGKTKRPWSRLSLAAGSFYQRDRARVLRGGLGVEPEPPGSWVWRRNQIQLDPEAEETDQGPPVRPRRPTPRSSNQRTRVSGDESQIAAETRRR